MTAKANIAENPSNRPSDEGGESLRGGEPLPDFNEAGEDAFLARIADRIMKDPKSHGVEGKSRAEILQYLEKAEDRVEAKWHEENHRNFKMLGVEETRKFLRRQGLADD